MIHLPRHLRPYPPPPSTPKDSYVFFVSTAGSEEALGRRAMASGVAAILRGKHKPTFAPHIDTGDHVVIINADKVVLTGAKATDKNVYDHSGYPGGLRTRSSAEFLASTHE